MRSKILQKRFVHNPLIICISYFLVTILLKSAFLTGIEKGATFAVSSVATMEDVEFMVVYIEKAKELKAANSDAISFAKALKATYPELAGAEGVDAMAINLYK